MCDREVGKPTPAAEMTEADEHRTYLADDVRLCRYAAALQRIVSPGDVVLDLGAGTGILGFFALKLAPSTSTAWTAGM